MTATNELRNRIAGLVAVALADVETKHENRPVSCVLRAAFIAARVAEIFQHVGWGEPHSLADVPPELRGNVSGLVFTDDLDDCDGREGCEPVYVLRARGGPA